MGYYIKQVRAKFFITKDQKDAALEAIRKLAGGETIKDASGKHYSWVRTENFVRAESLKEALEMWRWGITLDPNRNVVGISFGGEKAGDDKILFDAIAPFVQDESYIEMSGEDGERWRWLFTGGKCIQQKGRVVYE